MTLPPPGDEWPSRWPAPGDEWRWVLKLSLVVFAICLELLAIVVVILALFGVF